MKTENISHSNQLSNDKTHNRIDALLVLRGIACLMVVVIHSAPPRNAIIYRNCDFSWLTFSHGLVAVWVFFCLSGYLMGKVFYTQRYTFDIHGVTEGVTWKLKS
ncbi:MAG: acyltransferase family protein [Calothrix sp. C42_A2020_038]|nr:acyltransferase family protein [Calothrix sp. C42_A2020_038]